MQEISTASMSSVVNVVKITNTSWVVERNSMNCLRNAGVSENTQQIPEL